MENNKEINQLINSRNFRVVFLINKLPEYINAKDDMLSILSRLNFFLDKLGIEPELMTNEYQPDIDVIRSSYRGLIPNNIKIHNLYDFICGIERDDANYKLLKHYDIPKEYSFVRPSNLNNHDWFVKNEKSEIVRYISVNEFDSSLQSVDFYENDIIIRREIYDHRGFLSRIFEFKNRDSLEKSVFLRPNGTKSIEETYISIKVDNKLINKLNHITLYDDDGETVSLEVATKQEVITYWLMQFFNIYNSDDTFLVIGDEPNLYLGYLEYEKERENNPNFYFVPYIHTPHMSQPEKKDCNDFLPPFNYINKGYCRLSSLLVDFMTQRDDISKLLTDKSLHVFAIPSVPYGCYSDVNNDATLQTNDRNELTVASRPLDKSDLSELLVVLNSLQFNSKKFVINIFIGGGQSVKNLVLNTAIELNFRYKMTVYTDLNDMPSCLYKSFAFISCTPHKNDSFNILSALKFGCPVFIKNLGYESRDIIINEFNGFVINDSFREQRFIDEIIKLYSDNFSLDCLSKNALKSSDIYNLDVICKKWSDFILSVVK